MNQLFSVPAVILLHFGREDGLLSPEDTVFTKQALPLDILYPSIFTVSFLIFFPWYIHCLILNIFSLVYSLSHYSFQKLPLDLAINLEDGYVVVFLEKKLP